MSNTEVKSSHNEEAVQSVIEKLGLSRKEITKEDFEKVAEASDALLEAAKATGMGMFIIATGRNDVGGFNLINSAALSEAIFDEDAPVVAKLVSVVSRVESLMEQGIPFDIEMSIAGDTVLKMGLSEGDMDSH